MINLSIEEYKYRKREGDGICKLCFEWTFGKAYPESENIYCPNCSNNTLMGVDKAIESRLIRLN